ncbi:MAG: hypothetical protein WAV18_16915 [Roseiarcus sp.]
MTLDTDPVRTEPPRTIYPRRCHDAADPNRELLARRPPPCLYLEVTNRCNLLCATCRRTYVE